MSFTIKCDNCGHERKLEMWFDQITGKCDIDIREYTEKVIIECINCKNSIDSEY